MRRFPSSLLQFTPRDRQPSFFAIGMLVGAVWYFTAAREPSPSVLLVLTLATLSLAVWALRRKHSLNAIAAAVTLAGMAVGALSGSLASQRLDHARIEQSLGPVLLEGWVQSAGPARRGVRLVIRVHAIDGLAAAQTPGRVRVAHLSTLATEPGRFVRCWVVLRPPPAPVIEGDYAFDRQAWYEQLGAVGFVQGKCRGGALGAPTGWWRTAAIQIGRWRRRLAQHVRVAAGERAGGLAAALASGDRSFLTEADQTALRGAGLAHLLAISGLHMGLVGGLVFLIVWRGLALIEPLALRLSVKKPAACAALIACASYMIISGGSVSTQRAFVMASVFFGAVLLDRAALSQRSVAIAMIILLLLAPWSVLTPGFQMSFAATSVLIATYEGWRQRRQARGHIPRTPVTFWLKSLIVTSTVTSLATAPYAIYHFERFAGFGVAANILAMPIISVASAPLAAIAAILAPFGWGDWALRGFGLSLEWILMIAHLVAGGASGTMVSLPKMPAVSLGLYTGALMSACLGRGGRPRIVLVAGAFLMATLYWGSAGRDKLHWSPSGDVFFEHQSGRVDSIQAFDGPGLAPLRFSRLPRTGACPPSELCRRQVRGQAFVLADITQVSACRALADADVVLIHDPQSICRLSAAQTVIHWREVTRENGVTLVWTRGSFRKQRKPSCGSRPWQSCPKADLRDEP